MSEVVRVEARMREHWREIGSLRPGDDLGTMSTTADGHREVVLFGWFEDQPGVWRSRAGADVELGEMREVYSTGFDLVRDLRAGPWTLPVHTPEGTIDVRWSLA